MRLEKSRWAWHLHGLIGVAVVVGALMAVPAAHATFPGANGKLAFGSTRDGCCSQIYSMNADGTGTTRLTNIFANDRQPAWSADAKKVAFSRGGAIYAMNADGSNQTALTAGVSIDVRPTWSPDGRQIAFQRGSGEIYVMFADGSGQTQITFPHDGFADFDPAWSPDGAKIAFARRDITANTSQIYGMDPNGSNQTALSEASGNVAEPSWSPAGTKIAYRRGLEPEIFVMNANGSGEAALITSGGSDVEPTWSPDGTKIAFMSSRDEVHGEIYVANADGTGATRLTNNTSFDDVPDWGVAPGADLSVTNSDAPDPVVSGERLTYTITAHNSGQDATGVKVSDVLPASVVFKSASASQGTCTRTIGSTPKTKNGTVNCALGGLANGDSATVTIVVTPTTKGPLSDTATISGDQTDPTPGNNSATATTTVLGR